MKKPIDFYSFLCENEQERASFVLKRLWVCRKSKAQERKKGENKMPKMKTHRSAAKRYKVTASGKILRHQAGKGHLLAHKSPARKNRITGMVEVSDRNLDLITKELPYMKYSR